MEVFARCKEICVIFKIINQLRHFLFFIMLSISSSVFAAGFGQLQVYSYLNETLSAEIKLFGVDSFSNSQVIASLASPESFAQAKIARPFYLTKLDFEVIRTKEHGSYVYLSSRHPMQQPMVEFLINLHWPDGQIVRDFTILLDPVPPNLVASNRKVPITQYGPGANPAKYRPLPSHSKPEVYVDKTKANVSQKIVNSIQDVGDNNTVKPETVYDMDETNMSSLMAMSDVSDDDSVMTNQGKIEKFAMEAQQEEMPVNTIHDSQPMSVKNNSKPKVAGADNSSQMNMGSKQTTATEGQHFEKTEVKLLKQLLLFQGCLIKLMKNQNLP